jgi:hypothetical protein
MESRKYHKIRLSRAGNDTWKFLKEQKALEIPIISIATIVNCIVANKYYDILAALLYEFVALLIMCVFLFLWKSLRVVPEHIYNEQQDIIDSQREIIKSLEEQRRPKLEVTFKQGVRPWFQEQPSTTASGQDYIYRIELMNLGSETIHNLRVRLYIEPHPRASFNVPCDLQLNNKDIPKTDKEGEGEFVNVFKYFRPSKDGHEMLWINDIYQAKSKIPVQEYEIKIIVNSNNGGDSITKLFRFNPTKENAKLCMEMID